MNNQAPSIALSELPSIANSFNLPIMLHSETRNFSEIKTIFENADFVFKYFDLDNIQVPIESVLPIPVLPVNGHKKTVFFFDNIDSVDPVSFRAIFSHILNESEETFYTKDDTLIFSTYSWGNSSIPTPIINRMVHFNCK